MPHLSRAGAAVRAAAAPPTALRRCAPLLATLALAVATLAANAAWMADEALGPLVFGGARPPPPLSPLLPPFGGFPAELVAPLPPPLPPPPLAKLGDGGGDGGGGGARAARGAAFARAATSQRERFALPLLCHELYQPRAAGNASLPWLAPASAGIGDAACAAHASRAGAGGAGGAGSGADGALHLRDAADVERRLKLAAACTGLHQWSAQAQRAQEAAARLGKREPPGPETRRDVLLAHGAALNAAIAAFAEGYHIPMADWRGSVGHAGPWIEDYWRGSFHRPVRHALTAAQAVARARALVAARQADNGTRLVARECDRGGECSECVVKLAQVEARGAAGAGAPLCGGADGGAGGGGAPPATSELFLEAPYDAELFHPFVPLFVPWENINAAAAARNTAAKTPKKLGDFAFVLGEHPELLKLPATLVAGLGSLLTRGMRRDVWYVTVCQRPAGPWLARIGFKEALARTIVLSAGGNGHVALPLLARELPLLRVREEGAPAPSLAPPPPAPQGKAALQAELLPADLTPHLDFALVGNVTVPFPGEARRALSFYGKARDGARHRMLAVAAKALGARFEWGLLPNDPAIWVPYMAEATLAFAPRGNGLTSFRLYEALQLGVPPLFGYNGHRPWLPYHHPATATRDMAGRAPLPPGTYPSALPPPPPPGGGAPLLWDRVGHAVPEQSFEAWLAQAMELRAGAPKAEREAAWWSMRRAIEAAREEYFTYEGVLRHIWRFLADPWSAELYCTVNEWDMIKGV